MSSVAKKLVLLAFAFLLNGAEAREVRILVIGEGSAANCNVHLSGAVDGVYQIAKDGSEKHASDPLDWAECKGGSIWIPLGEKLVHSGVGKVVILSLAKKEAKAKDWLPGGRAFQDLNHALTLFKERRIRFDYALWQHGYSDFETDASQYFRDTRAVLRMVSQRAKIGKWLIASGIKCNDRNLREISASLVKIGQESVFNRYPGANENLLGDETRLSDCGFTTSGQDKMAHLWFDAINKAEKKSIKYQKETLLYYFK